MKMLLKQFVRGVGVRSHFASFCAVVRKGACRSRVAPLFGRRHMALSVGQASALQAPAPAPAPAPHPLSHEALTASIVARRTETTTRVNLQKWVIKLETILQTQKKLSERERRTLRKSYYNWCTKSIFTEDMRVLYQKVLRSSRAPRTSDKWTDDFALDVRAMYQQMQQGGEPFRTTVHRASFRRRANRVAQRGLLSNEVRDMCEKLLQ